MKTFEATLGILRRLAHRPAFVTVVLATLAVSLGAAATMFTVVHAFLLSSLPLEEADRLVMIWNEPLQGTAEELEPELPLSPGAFTDLREASESFERLAAFFPEAVTLTGPEKAGARRVQAWFVTEGFFDLLGVEAAVGRALAPDDARPEAPAVVVLGHDLWQRQFAGDREILHRTLEFGGRTHQIVGVLPEEFHFAESLVASNPALSRPVDLWVPFSLGARAHERGFHYLTTLGRLEPGVSVQAARDEMDAYALRAGEEHPDTDGSYGLAVIPLHEQVFGALSPVLWTLLTATLFLLLIACINLAALRLARVLEGEQNLAVRLALGASRSRILLESLVGSTGLALAGGALALGWAFVAIRGLTALNPVPVFRSYPPQLDLEVVLFTLGLSLIAGLGFGLLPAIRASRTGLAKTLGAGGGRLTSGSRLVFSALVAAQIALTTTLLIGMGLSFKSFHGLLHADLGVRPAGVVTFDVFLPRSHYRDPTRKVGFFRELLDRMASLPDVEAVGMNYALPFSGVNPSNGFEIEGRPRRPGEEPSANLGLVNPGYFDTLGIPLLHGRTFRRSDTAEAPPVAIVDERMVQQHFRGEEPLGRRISIASDEKATIIGVVGAVRQDAFKNVARPYVYLPYPQRSYLFTKLAVRTDLEEPFDLTQSLRGAARELDAGVPLSNFSTLEKDYARALAPHRFSLLLISLFAGLSLFLTVVGIYSVMAFLVRQRTREAGIRMALGAAPRQIFGLIFQHGLALSLAGTLIGLILALAAGRALATLAYGIEPYDALVFSVVPAVTLLAAFAAYYPPARSLSRVEPNKSLRST